MVENLRLGRGARGRGLFVERAGEPSCIAVPRHLLVPVDMIALQNDRLVVKDGADVAPQARALFEDYYATIGFSRDAIRDARRAISGQHQLPGPLQDMILKGNSKGLTRFPAFDPATVLDWFCNTRSMESEAGRVLMPLVDLVNHDAQAAPFGAHEGGVRVEGAFKDEVLVRYHTGDPWSVYLRWGFAAPSDRAYSLGLSVTEPAGWQIKVRAETRPTPRLDDTMITVEGRTLTIDRFLLVGHGDVQAARALFRSRVADYGLADCDELFSLICKINKDWFHKVLQLSKGSAANPSLKTIRMAAKVQLKLLSHAVQD